VRVQYHERFDVIAEFDPASGRIQPIPRPTGLSPAATEGWFSILAGTCVVFYRSSAHLWLRVGDQTFDLDGEASVDWRVEDGSAVFAAADDTGQVLLRYRAGPFSGPSISDDPTPFVEDEHWDLGLFIANVMFDEERSDLVRRGPS
jgi:hypothetical protein